MPDGVTKDRDGKARAHARDMKKEGKPHGLMSSGDVVAGQFEVIRPLGRGGMGVVYEAKDRVTGERLALKTLLPAYARNRKAVDRFLAEVKASRSLKHENIVAVYDVGRDGDRIFFTMEFLEGKSLRRVMEKTERFTLEEAAGVLLPLCDALAYAHETMVHRDLSPENVMVLEDGTVKLLDFGLARAADRTRMTATGAVLGKAHYISPEQLKNAAGVDQRSDIYSLGVMVFEMLSGQPPVGYQTLGELRPDLPESCDALVAQCLAPVDKRVKSAREFRKRFERCLRDERQRPVDSLETSAPPRSAQLKRVDREAGEYRPLDRPQDKEEQEATGNERGPDLAPAPGPAQEEAPAWMKKLAHLDISVDLDKTTGKNAPAAQHGMSEGTRKGLRMALAVAFGLVLLAVAAPLVLTLQQGGKASTPKIAERAPASYRSDPVNYAATFQRNSSPLPRKTELAPSRPQQSSAPAPEIPSFLNRTWRLSIQDSSPLSSLPKMVIFGEAGALLWQGTDKKTHKGGWNITTRNTLLFTTTYEDPTDSDMTTTNFEAVYDGRTISGQGLCRTGSKRTAFTFTATSSSPSYRH